MIDSSTTTSSMSSDLATLKEQFTTANEKNQLQILPSILAAGDGGIEILMQWLQSQQGQHPTIVAGTVYQSLYQSESTLARPFLDREFPQGIVPLDSAMGIDYLPLQQLLAAQDFQSADKLTTEKLCQLAGDAAVQRKWLYFTDVEQFPITDLKTLDLLWLIHSGGKFAFSIQRNLWLGVGKNWDKLWPKIGWKDGNNWTRYPGSFTWDLTAPKGHLPLSNQLRGVRTIAALFEHSAWDN
jgi:GUN4-like/ARM-like repeat domain, GUN4-N terminal